MLFMVKVNVLAASVLLGLLSSIAVSGVNVSSLTGADKANYDQYYSTGVQAYLWGFPVFLFQTLELRLTSVTPVNYYVYNRKLSDYTSRAVVLPNVDTIYGYAFLRLKNEPIVIELPDTSGRYYSATFIDEYSENLKLLGTSHTGTRAQTWTVLPSGWKGVLPAALNKKKFSIKTPDIFFLVRILVFNDSDIPNVLNLHTKIKVRTLTDYLAGKNATFPSPLPPPPVNPAPATYSPALKNFFYIAQGAVTNPPPSSNVGILDLFKQIGFTSSGFTNASSAIALQALEDAAAAAENIALYVPPGKGKSFNGWSWLPLNGVFKNEFAIRAFVAKVLYLALPPSEAVYYFSSTDSSGRSLDGGKKYTLTFYPPPVKSFWSLTLYNGTDLFLLPTVSKYAVSDRTPGFKLNSDKTVTVYIQSTSPGSVKVANWLPSLPGVPLFLVLRAYIGKPQLFTTYTIPAAKEVV